MSMVISSEATHLLYRLAPRINFAQVVADICIAFTPASGTHPVLTWDCDDIALIDFRAARVVISLSDNLPGQHTACITIAAGQSPMNATITFAKPEQLLLCDAVSSRITRRFPCDTKNAMTYAHPPSADLVKAVRDTLSKAAVNPANKPALTIVASAKNAAIAIGPVPELGDLDRLLHRLSTELTLRPPSLITRAIACVTPNGQNPSTVKPTTVNDLNVREAQICQGQTSAGKSTGGVFWRNNRAERYANTQKFMQPHRLAPTHAVSTDVNAIRKALYDRDLSRPAGLRRIAMHTKRALQSLAALPLDFAAVVANSWHVDKQMLENRIKH